MSNHILEILQEIRPDVDFMSSSDFIEDYLLDSFDIIKLTSDLEKKYEIKIPTKEILPENYQSVEVITNLIRKCGGTV
jgi:acyl carrier protein